MQNLTLKLLALAVTACISLEPLPPAFASGTEQYIEVYEKPGFKHNYADLTEVLEKSLTPKSELDPIARLQRSKLKAQEKRLDAILSKADRVSHGDFYEFSRQQKSAFVVNVANAWILKFVVNHKELTSAADLEAAPITILGETHSLAKLRKMVDTSLGVRPLAILALLCFNAHCPELKSSALNPEKADVQMENIAEAFLRDSSKNTFNEKTGVFSVSPAILLNRKSLEKEYGTLGGFLARYMVRDRVITWKAKSGAYRIEATKEMDGWKIDP